MSDRLFLFDVDGTLIRAGTRVHRDAFAYAFSQVYGLPLSLDGWSAAGRTDVWLLKRPLEAAGVDTEIILGRMPRALEVMQDYVEEHLSDLRECVLPGVPEVLAGLAKAGHILGLITGNLSRIGAAKMRQAHLAQFFRLGGFGEESEVRADLVPVAIEKARELQPSVSPASTIVIGDTPLDVEAGSVMGTRTVAVATGPFSVAELELSQPDLVIESFSDPVNAVALLTGISPKVPAAANQVTPEGVD